MTWDEDDNNEGIDAEDADDSGDDLLQCPGCARAVHEDTQQCPHCGDWITPVYPQTAWKRWLWLVTAILLVLLLSGILLL